MKTQINKQNLITAILSLLLIVGLVGGCIALFGGNNSNSGSNTTTHKHTYEVTTTLTDCTRGGTKTETCKECKYTKTTNIAPTEHSLISGEAVAATCTQNGRTAFEKCMVCDYGDSAKIIPALGHDLYVASEATVSCTTNGQTALKKCNNCNYQEGGETILAIGHNYILQIAYEPTCSETGKSFEFCEYCHNIINETVIPVDSSKHSFVGNVCEACDYELPSTFSINNKNYNITGDITWAEWVKTSANTGGYVRSYDYISLSVGGTNGILDAETGEIIRADEKIKHGANYTYGSAIVYFYVGDTQLQTLLGMPWNDWLISSYNTMGLKRYFDLFVFKNQTTQNPIGIIADGMYEKALLVSTAPSDFEKYRMEAVTGSITVNATQVYFLSGMTWADMIASDYHNVADFSIENGRVYCKSLSEDHAVFDVAEQRYVSPEDKIYLTTYIFYNK